jgi:hypothetical protein
MSRAVGLLTATTVLFAASTLYFAWALGVERDRGADFAAAGGARPAMAGSAADASAHDGIGTTGAHSARPEGTSAGKSSGSLDRLGTLAGGGRKRPSRELSGELFKRDFDRMFADPVTRQQLIEEQIPRYRDRFIVLERRLDLPSAQWRRFLETMATQEVERRGNTAVCEKDIECLMRSAGPETYARDEQEIRDVLGDADMKQFQTFNYSVSERQSVEALQSRLPQFQKLSEGAAEDLITALSDVRRATEKSIQAENGSFITFSGDGYVFVYPPNLKTLQERLSYAYEQSKKLRQRAAPLLNETQFIVYQGLHKEALRSLQRAMAATPELAR